MTLRIRTLSLRETVLVLAAALLAARVVVPVLERIRRSAEESLHPPVALRHPDTAPRSSGR